MPAVIAIGVCFRPWPRSSCAALPDSIRTIRSIRNCPRVAFALDSSIISLSLNLFPWGYYARSRQSALKLHLLLSLQGNLPAWGTITQAGFPDLKILDRLPVLRGAH